MSFTDSKSSDSGLSKAVAREQHIQLAFLRKPTLKL
jgi:hypothetical protein